MVDEARITRLEARIMALELAVSQIVFMALVKAEKNPENALKDIKMIVLAEAKNKAFPELDAARSDLVASEFEAALERILTMIEELFHNQD